MGLICNQLMLRLYWPSTAMLGKCKTIQFETTQDRFELLQIKNRVRILCVFLQDLQIRM